MLGHTRCSLVKVPDGVVGGTLLARNRSVEEAATRVLRPLVLLLLGLLGVGLSLSHELLHLLGRAHHWVPVKWLLAVATLRHQLLLRTEHGLG